MFGVKLGVLEVVYGKIRGVRPLYGVKFGVFGDKIWVNFVDLLGG